MNESRVSFIVVQRLNRWKVYVQNINTNLFIKKLFHLFNNNIKPQNQIVCNIIPMLLIHKSFDNGLRCTNGTNEFLYMIQDIFNVLQTLAVILLIIINNRLHLFLLSFNNYRSNIITMFLVVFSMRTITIWPLN